MADINVALIITAAGYGINILILGIIGAIIWGITKFIGIINPTEKGHGKQNVRIV